MKRKSLIILAPIALIIVIACVSGFGKTHYDGNVLAPHLKVNGVTYWIGEHSQNAVPQGFECIGKILSVGKSDGSPLEEFQSSFGDIGADIYANPDNPDYIFVADNGANGYGLSGYTRFEVRT